MREDANKKSNERSAEEEKVLQEAIDRRMQRVWKAMLIWTGFNLVLWVVWWLYGQEFKHHRPIGTTALSFWLLFTGFVWSQVVFSLVDYFKLEKRKRLLKDLWERERLEAGKDDSSDERS